MSEKPDKDPNKRPVPPENSSSFSEQEEAQAPIQSDMPNVDKVRTQAYFLYRKRQEDGHEGTPESDWIAAEASLKTGEAPQEVESEDTEKDNHS